MIIIRTKHLLEECVRSCMGDGSALKLATSTIVTAADNVWMDTTTTTTKTTTTKAAAAAIKCDDNTTTTRRRR